jgi:hypothetical protein
MDEIFGQRRICERRKPTRNISMLPPLTYTTLSKNFIHFYFPSKIFIGIKTILRRKG